MTHKKLPRNHQDILKELKVRDETIGFADDLGRVAVLKPRKEVEKDHLPMYDSKVQGLGKEGYEVLYTSHKKGKGILNKYYDVFEKL